MSPLDFNSPETSVSLSFLAVLFSVGAIQLAGWNFSFPTVVETWLWRISGLGLIATSIALVIYWGFCDNASADKIDLTLLGIFVLLRLYTCVEVVRWSEGGTR